MPQRAGAARQCLDLCQLPLENSCAKVENLLKLLPAPTQRQAGRTPTLAVELLGRATPAIPRKYCTSIACFVNTLEPLPCNISHNLAVSVCLSVCLSCPVPIHGRFARSCQGMEQKIITCGFYQDLGWFNPETYNDKQHIGLTFRAVRIIAEIAEQWKRKTFRCSVCSGRRHVLQWAAHCNSPWNMCIVFFSRIVEGPSKQLYCKVGAPCSQALKSLCYGVRRPDVT